ncbi:unnamed protein product [Closterium sp. NIES-53]
MDTSTATAPLLAEVGEPAAEDIEDVPFPSPSLAPRSPPLVAVLRGLTPMSASSDEGRREEEAEEVQPTMVKSAKGAGTRQQLTREQAAAKPTKEQSATGRLAVEPTKGEKSVGTPAVLLEDAEGSNAGGNEAEQADAEEYTNSNEVEVRPRRTGRLQRPPDFFVPAAFTTVYDEVDNDLLYDDSEEDEDLPELDLDMHADPEHHWDISTMTVKEALASWKDKAMKAAMEEEICNLIGMGTWELVKRPPQVNIMKNRWLLTTKYHIDHTVEREKARLVVKGFT